MPDSERVEHPAGAVETPAHVALRRAKRQALALLLVVTAVFVATSLVERGLLLNCIKAMAEAAGDPRILPAMQSFTDQQGGAMARLRAFGDVLGGITTICVMP